MLGGRVRIGVLLCGVMYNFIKSHSDELRKDVKEYGYDTLNDMLQAIKNDQSVAIWALEVLCDTELKCNYKDDIFVDHLHHKPSEVYMILDEYNPRYFTIDKNDNDPRLVECDL